MRDAKNHISHPLSLTLLLMPFTGFASFIIGQNLSGSHATIGYILMGLGVLLTMLFYFITFLNAIHAFSSDPNRKIFWVIAIICLPVIGNVIYVIFNEMANRQQQPHGVF